MTDCISLRIFDFSSESCPVTRYSTDTPRAWAILKAETTSGNRSCVIHPRMVKRLIPAMSATACCFVFLFLIKVLTFCQKSNMFIFSVKKNCHLTLFVIDKIVKQRYKIIKRLPNGN